MQDNDLKVYRLEMEPRYFEALVEEIDRRIARSVQGGGAWQRWTRVRNALGLARLTAVPAVSSEVSAR